MAEDPKIGRREFLTVAGAAAAALAPALPAEAQQAQPVAPPATTPVATVAARPVDEPLLTLTATEHAFFAAAADTMIPPDNLSPSGSDCGVANFIDRQLAGAYGSGARLYRQGPFPKGKPEQGYADKASLQADHIAQGSVDRVRRRSARAGQVHERPRTG